MSKIFCATPRPACQIIATNEGNKDANSILLGGALEVLLFNQPVDVLAAMNV